MSKDRPRGALWAVLLLVTLLGAGSCTERDSAEGDPARQQTVAAEAAVPGSGEAGARAAGVRRRAGLDVLLITVDTLRADALGAYGNGRSETPWTDRLAAAGVRFTNAHAHNVLTLPSHANMLSGLYPQEHGVRDNAGFRFPAEVPTLATLLREQGYRTAAFVSAFPLDSRFGLARGFDVYEDSFVDATERPAFLEQERAGVDTVALALEWLASSDGRPSFCWLHLYEPHFPYAPPEPLASRFWEDPYLGDVAAADAALGPVLAPILDAGVSGSTLVVLTSDHGESLGEHGEATHGIFAYESVLKAPLILYQPRLFEPRTVDAPARHVDLLPTILDALALTSPAGLRGRSLLAAAAGLADENPPAVYFEALSGQLNQGWAPLHGLIEGHYKYIELPIPELYDLQADPGEERNLASSEPRRAAELRAQLRPLLAADVGSQPSVESEEVRRRLESLGYLSGGVSGKRKQYDQDDDPKRLIVLDAMLREIVGRHVRGDLEGALELCRELVRRRPGMKMALLHLAQLERESGNFGPAIEALSQALALDPTEPTTLALLATYLTQAGREAEAVAVTEPHAALREPDIDVLLTRGLALARLGRGQQALATFGRAREVDPGNPLVAVYLGTFHLMAGDRGEARAAYRQALEINPRVARAHSSLGIMAAEEGKIEEALEHWRRALREDPQELDKLFAVGTGLWRAGRTAVGRSLLELFVVSAPSETSGSDLELARQLLASG